jgi:hypothetical protein
MNQINYSIYKNNKTITVHIKNMGNNRKHLGSNIQNIQKSILEQYFRKDKVKEIHLTKV